MTTPAQSYKEYVNSQLVTYLGKYNGTPLWMTVQTTPNTTNNNELLLVTNNLGLN